MSNCSHFYEYSLHVFYWRILSLSCSNMHCKHSSCENIEYHLLSSYTMSKASFAGWLYFENICGLARGDVVIAVCFMFANTIHFV